MSLVELLARPVAWTRFIPHEPHAKQHAFLTLTHREALYGGAAGGGKSDALLMAALQYVDAANYAAILFRKTHRDLALPGALMDRAKEWLAPTAAKWNDQDKTWSFPSGAKLAFGYLDGPDDRFRYQSAEFQFIGFDEATQFSERDYSYLFSRLRRLEGSHVPLRMRAASNPGGAGHEWVKRRFVDAVSRGDRVFIPARLDDNPSLDQAEYEASLAELDEWTRAQLLNGDWDVVEPDGREFFDHDRLNQLAPRIAPPIRVGRLTGDPARGGKVRFVENPAGPLHVFRAPRPGERFVVFADTAGGISDDEYQSQPADRKGDYCAAQVVSLTDGVQVAEYEERIDEDEFARELAMLGYVYAAKHSAAEIAVENAGGHGLLTLGYLRDTYAYPAIYHHEPAQHEHRGERSHSIGWPTNATTRPLMLGELTAVLRQDATRLRSRRLVAQMRRFIYNRKGRVEAAAGSHDDLVMAAAGAMRLYTLRAAKPLDLRPPRPKRKPVRSIQQRALAS